MILTEREAKAEKLSYTEEAIPERDPAFRLESSDYPTVSDMPKDMRFALCATLIDLGMAPWRARAAAEL